MGTSRILNRADTFQTPSLRPELGEAPKEINILTLNCWGLKFLAKFRNERLREIGYRIANAQPVPHIVGLQECWTQQDYREIRDITKQILPYGKFYHSGVFGGGLVILSKWPIEESSMFQYPLNGRPTAFFRGDWYVGKGVASARIRFGPGSRDIAEVFTTHLHAPYEREPHDSYICHRTAQAWEIAKLMRGAAERGHLVIGLGDFNMIPLSLAHRLVTSHAPVRDVWRVLHPDSSIGAAVDLIEKARQRPIPTAEFNILQNGATCDGVFNTWRWSKAAQKDLLERCMSPEIPGDTPDPKAKRLDYIFAGKGSLPGEDWGWVVKRTAVGMMDRHRTLKCSLSDHFSVEATLVRYSSPGVVASGEDPAVEAPIIEQKALSSELGNFTTQLQASPSTHLPIAVYDEILAMIDKYRLRERKQRRLRLAHFVGSIILFIICLVGVWFSPPGVAFMLVFISSLSLGAGIIDGLIGGLFVGSELRALKEFEWEICNAKVAAGGAKMDEEEYVRAGI